MTATDDATVNRMRVTGTRQLVLSPTPEKLGSFELETRNAAIDCSTGEREGGKWIGIPVSELLERIDPDDGTTHLLVSGVDGYRACLPIDDVLDAIVAIERTDSETDRSLPRLVGDSIQGTRAIKRVQEISTLSLSRGEDPSEYESLDVD